MVEDEHALEEEFEDGAGGDHAEHEEHGEHDDPEHDPDEEHEHAEAEPPAPEPEPEPEWVYEEVEDGDHRVAQLRKMRTQFGPDYTLTNSNLQMEDTGPALIVCPNCNSEEVRGLKFCTHCNARLPQIVVIEQKYNPGSIDGAARKYHEAITNFHEEKLSLDEFVDFLSKGLERVRKHQEHITDLSADGVIAEWLPQANSLIENATQLWHDSVESMLVRVDDAQAEYEEEEAMLMELEEEELAEREPLVPLEERVRMIDFTPELESIFRSNDQMLEYLRILDNNLKNDRNGGGMQF